MEHPTLSPRLRIADLLAGSPSLVALFIELHVDCIGCSMNKFCTLEELCAQYELDLPTVLARIEAF
jgi:hypothetical protein